MKARGISSTKHTETSLRSKAFLAWNLGELDSISQYNNDLTFLADPPAVSNRLVNRPPTSNRLRPFRTRDRSRGGDSTVNTSGAGFCSRSMPPCSTVSTDPPNHERGEVVHRNSSNIFNLPLSSNSNLDPKFLSDRNNPVVGMLLSELYFIIRNKKELHHNPWDIVSELERLIVNYQNL